MFDIWNKMVLNTHNGMCLYISEYNFYTVVHIKANLYTHCDGSQTCTYADLIKK